MPDTQTQTEQTAFNLTELRRLSEAATPFDSFHTLVQSHYEFCRYVFEHRTAIIEALERAEAEKWIGVEERLPEEDGTYNVTVRGSVDHSVPDWRGRQIVYARYYDGKEWYDGDKPLTTADLTYWPITHWRPLPAPPATGIKEEEV